MTPALGKYADDGSNDSTHATILYLGGVQYSVIALVLLASTFVPRGAWSINPKLSGEKENGEKDSAAGGGEEETSNTKGEEVIATTASCEEREREAGAAVTIG
jgi:hypothetical protein